MEGYVGTMFEIIGSFVDFFLLFFYIYICSDLVFQPFSLYTAFGLLLYYTLISMLLNSSTARLSALSLH